MSDQMPVIAGTGTIGSELLRWLAAVGIETRALTCRAEGGPLNAFVLLEHDRLMGTAAFPS